MNQISLSYYIEFFGFTEKEKQETAKLLVDAMKEQKMKLTEANLEKYLNDLEPKVSSPHLGIIAGAGMYALKNEIYA